MCVPRARTPFSVTSNKPISGSRPNPDATAPRLPTPAPGSDNLSTRWYASPSAELNKPVRESSSMFARGVLEPAARDLAAASRPNVPQVLVGPARNGRGRRVYPRVDERGARAPVANGKT